MTPGDVILWALAILLAVVILILAFALVAGVIRWAVEDHLKRHPKAEKWGVWDESETTTR